MSITTQINIDGFLIRTGLRKLSTQRPQFGERMFVQTTNFSSYGKPGRIWKNPPIN